MAFASLYRRRVTRYLDDAEQIPVRILQYESPRVASRAEHDPPFAFAALVRGV
jgi:hypothetical protein